jgi:uncharacterized Zn finger protein
VYHLLGEIVIQNPIRLLTLRGIDPLPSGRATASRLAVDSTNGFQPLNTNNHNGWKPLVLSIPKDNRITAPLLMRLGAIPFWRGQERFLDTLDILYQRAYTRSKALFDAIT